MEDVSSLPCIPIVQPFQITWFSEKLSWILFCRDRAIKTLLPLFTGWLPIPNILHKSLITLVLHSPVSVSHFSHRCIPFNRDNIYQGTFSHQWCGNSFLSLSFPLVMPNIRIETAENTNTKVIKRKKPTLQAIKHWNRLSRGTVYPCRYSFQWRHEKYMLYSQRSKIASDIFLVMPGKEFTSRPRSLLYRRNVELTQPVEGFSACTAHLLKKQPSSKKCSPFCDWLLLSPGWLHTESTPSGYMRSTSANSLPCSLGQPYLFTRCSVSRSGCDLAVCLQHVPLDLIVTLKLVLLWAKLWTKWFLKVPARQFTRWSHDNNYEAKKWLLWISSKCLTSFYLSASEV